MKWKLLGGLIAAAIVALPVAVLAGGWAVVTLDTLPDHIVADRSLTIGFTVLRHGQTPLTDLAPVVVLTSIGTGETLRYNAANDNVPGHYVVTMTFPEEGQWAWTIHPQPYPAVAMPRLTILPPSVAAATLLERPDTGSLWRWIALASGLSATGAFALAAGVGLRAVRMPAPQRGA